VTGTNCVLVSHNQSRSHLNHLVFRIRTGKCSEIYIVHHVNASVSRDEWGFNSTIVDFCFMLNIKIEYANGIQIKFSLFYCVSTQ
jgi:hypothetical protein